MRTITAGAFGFAAGSVALRSLWADSQTGAEAESQSGVLGESAADTGTATQKAGGNPNAFDESALTAEVEKQMADGLFHGAVVAVGTSDQLLYSRCWGWAQGTPKSADPVPMRLDSQFDVASITKTQTASALALLAAQGKLNPDAPFIQYLPEHSAKNSPITVRDLAMHTGGFYPSHGFSGPDEAAFWKYLRGKQPVRPRGERFEYACYNFILLGKIVERVSGQRLDEFCRQNFYQPLGMAHSEWGPVPTRPTTVQVIATKRVGDISDFQAKAAPFPIGNAGFFSTAGDLALFCRQMLEHKRFPKDYYDLQFTCGFDKNGARRSFGWDMCDHRRPVGLSRDTIFHSGWSGQSYWIDPTNDFFAVCLTNRFGDWERAMQGRQRIGGILRTITTG